MGSSTTARPNSGAPDGAGVPFSVAAGERELHAWLQSTVQGHTRRIELLLAALMAPLGFWSAHTGRPATELAILAMAIALGLGVIPWLSQTGPIPLREWLAASGVAAGWAAGAPAAYLASRCGSPSASESSSS